MVTPLNETENLIGSIKSIIHDYPSDSSLFKEFLQNSDDAGAKEQTFILDARTHGTDTIVDTHLEDSQGPALLCLNESVFQKSNWSAIKSARSSDKLSDSNQTGKYGVGFRSCYHVTDNPHVLSGDTLLILDPHYAFATYPGGVTIDVQSERTRFPDQFAPFLPMVPSFGPYPGTVIRLPLRTESQVQKVRAVDQELGGAVATLRMKKLIGKFMDNEASTCLLFLRNIKTITYKEIDEDGVHTTVASVNLQTIQDEDKAADRIDCVEGRVTARSSAGAVSLQSWLIVSTKISDEEAAQSIATRIGYRQAPAEIQSKLVQEKLRPRVSIAFPMDSPLENGKLFTLLPLPIVTQFPVHINGTFSLMSNRQRLEVVEGKQASLNLDAWLRVQWNYFVFEQLLPPLWARLLSILVYEARDSWKAWPRISHGGAHCYWEELPKRVLEEFISHQYSIVSVGAGEAPIRLDEVLVSDSTLNSDLLQTLTRVGIHIVSPPAEVLYVVRLVNHRYAEPDTVCLYMKDHLASLNIAVLAREDRNLILDYLLDPTNCSSLRRLSGLPLFPTVDDSFTTPAERDWFASEDTETALVLLKPEEEKLFADLKNASSMIPLSRISPHASALLAKPEATSSLDVTLLGSAHVSRFLADKLGSWSAKEGSNEQALPKWLIAFWQWVPTWDGARDLLATSEVLELPLVPSQTGSLRCPVDGILLRADLDVALATLLVKIGVPVSHEELDVESLKTVSKSPNDVGFVLAHLDPQAISELPVDELPAVRQYFLERLKHNPAGLPSPQKTIFFSLPIFTVIQPQESGDIQAMELHPIRGQPIYVDAPQCPLPVENSYHEESTYVDVTDSATRALVEYAHGSDRPPFLDEPKILEIAIPILEKQPLDLLDRLFIRVVHRFPDLPPAACKTLRSICCVPVSRDVRKRPNEVIDPNSTIARLYDGERDRILHGYDTPGYQPLIKAMRSHELLVSTLDEGIVRERIRYIVGTHNRQALLKAKVLVELLNDSPICANLSEGTKSLLRQHAWLPCRQERICLPKDCRHGRTKEEMYLFDTVLAPLDAYISNGDLLKWIGWHDSLPFDTLLLQLNRTLIPQEDGIRSSRFERLRALSRCFRDLFNRGWLEEEDLEKLRDAVGIDIPWFPFGDELVATKYLLLSEECPVGQGSNFRVLPRKKAESWAGFLREMHCPDRPAAHTIIQELESLARCSESASDPKILVDQSGLLLKSYVRLEYALDSARLLAPNIDGTFRSLNQLQYNDLGTTTPSLASSGVLHPSISRELAEELNIQFLSSAVLGEDDQHDEEFEMAENLKGRIKGVLKKYDIEMVANELLANAIDADASVFSILLDQCRYPNAIDQLPTVKMQQLQLVPSLFFHNDSKFEEKDFKGICRIGQGGKGDSAGTIGRFGIGALSMFHFTEVVMFVSDGYMQILDPSGEYLPPYPQGRKRTALRRKLVDIARKYPHLLTPFLGVCNFPASLDDEELNGYDETIFRLPLKNGVEVQSCISWIEGQYQTLARHAFLFNHNLAYVHAYYRRAADFRTLWTITSNVTPAPVCGQPSSGCAEGDEICMTGYHLELVVHTSGRTQNAQHSRSTSLETWLVVQAVCPVTKVKQYTDVLAAHKYSNHPHITAHLAFCLSSDASASATRAEHHIFSRLMIPHTTNLPFHLDAPFALSDDRRNIRFETVQGQMSREGEYNTLLLSEIIPPLYHFGLSVIGMLPAATPGATLYDRWWPHDDPKNEISSVVTHGFYQLLPTTSHPICITSSGSPVCPKDALFCLRELRPVHTENLQVILSTLVKDKLVVLSPQTRRTLQIRKVALPSISASICKQVVQDREEELVETNLTPKDVSCLLEFLHSGKPRVSPLHTRLLLTEDGVLRRFEAQGTTVLDLSRRHGQREFIVNLFPKDRFLHRDIPGTQANCLVEDPSLTIYPFSVSHMISLVKERISTGDYQEHPPEDRIWVYRLLEVVLDLLQERELRELLDSADFLHIPLFSTSNPRRHVSLHYARGHCLRVQAHDPSLTQLLFKLGVAVMNGGSRFEKVIMPRMAMIPPFSLRSLLYLSRNPTGPEHLQWGELDDTELKELTGKIGADIDSPKAAPLEDDLLQELSKYPMWTTVTCTGVVNLRTKACDLHMLADGLDINSISPYIRPGNAVAQYSTALHTTLRLAPNRVIKRERLIEFIDMPNIQIEGTEVALDGFRRMLLVVLDSIGPFSTQLKLPNTTLFMKRPEELYDSTVPVFEKSFARNHANKLLHPSLQDLQPHLRSVGLQYEITQYSLLQCAQALHEQVIPAPAGSSPIEPVEELLEVARLVFGHYSEKHGSALWVEFRNLHFVPRHPRRRSGYIYNDINDFCLPLPMITSPNSVLRPTLEQICWTQRACMTQESSVPVQSADWTLGVPTTIEVVNHLVVLATKLLQKHPEYNMLLSDLQETYKWLNNHCEDAREPLLEMYNVPLFLNVDETGKADDRAHWKCANQLVHGLRYDKGGLFTVRGSLKNYRPLLQAAGVKSWFRPDYNTLITAQDGLTDLRRSVNSLRTQNLLLDWKLLPSRSDLHMAESPTNFPTGRLRCHRAIMVASIPHLKTPLVSEWAESGGDEYAVDASYFAVASLIDFVYTEDLAIEEPRDGHEAEELLENLLELLSLADQWNLESLKQKVGVSVHQYKLISPDTLPRIKEASENAHLSSLHQYCTDLEAANAESLSALRREGRRDGPG